MTDLKKIRGLVAENRDKLIEYRRTIHSNPELSFHESETAAYITSQLDEMKIPYKTGVGGYGIVAHIGFSDQKVVALRADMDALPIQEENEVPYASKNAGVMHACGHDVHTACLLGAAQALKSVESTLGGKVRLLFQPAEERLPGGASLMIADGALRNPDVELIFGSHVFPDMEVGNVGFREGMYMASTDEIYITVKGEGGHGALPHTCVDPVLISAHLITALQQLVSRRSRPDMPTVLTIGKVVANGATNIIPDKVSLEGTLRTFDESWRAEAHELITGLATGLCKSMGGSAEIDIRKGYPCLVNDPQLTAWAKDIARELLGAEKVHDLPLRMTAEDFAWFAQEVPGCFYRLGTSNAEKKIGAPLHTSKFDIDEDALEIGATLMATLALRALAEK